MAVHLAFINNNVDILPIQIKNRVDSNTLSDKFLLRRNLLGSSMTVWSLMRFVETCTLSPFSYKDVWGWYPDLYDDSVTKYELVVLDLLSRFYLKGRRIFYNQVLELYSLHTRLNSLKILTINSLISGIGASTLQMYYGANTLLTGLLNGDSLRVVQPFSLLFCSELSNKLSSYSNFNKKNEFFYSLFTVFNKFYSVYNYIGYMINIGGFFLLKNFISLSQFSVSLFFNFLTILSKFFNQAISSNTNFFFDVNSFAVKSLTKFITIGNTAGNNRTF